MADLSPNRWIITLNINGLNIHIKRLSVRSKKNDPTICYLQKMYFICDIDRLKVKEWKEIHHASINQSKTEAAILMSQ